MTADRGGPVACPRAGPLRGHREYQMPLVLVRRFLDPELIHADESPRIVDFESIPQCEIGHHAILGE